MKHVISQDGEQIQIEATFPQIFGAHMRIQCTIKVKIHVLVRWLYNPPPLPNYVDY
jgi:hypothetical protein